MKLLPTLIMAAAFLSTQACPAGRADPYRDAMAGSKMNATQAGELESALAAKPDDMAARTKLLGYYFMAGRGAGDAREHRRKHVLWVIKNHPASDLAALPYCGMDSITDAEGFVEAKKLWLEQATAHPQDAKVLGNAAAFLLLADRKLAEDFLKRAKKVEPGNPQWADNLGQLYALSDGAAAKSLEEYESAQATDKEEMSRFYRLDQLAKAAFKAGNPEKAERYAQELLAGAGRFPNDWNDGNAVHHGNNVLGLCALKRGDAKLATEFLIKAGKTPGSPQLNSFGPNMTLAKALLENGAKDAVLEYFDLCRKFWKSGGAQLDRWTKDIKAGNAPDFGGNLAY